MDFGFSEEQLLLRAEVRRFLDQNCPLDAVRKIVETPEGHSRDLWSRMAELGWVGLTIPEVHGGAGLGWVDLVVVLEETGRTLLPSPLIATVLAAAGIEHGGSPEVCARWLPSLADGSVVGSVALLESDDHLAPEGITLAGERDGSSTVLSGQKLFVPDAQAADLFVVAFRSGSGRDALSLALVEKGAPGLTIESLPTLDATRRQGRLRFDGVRVDDASLLGEPGQAWPAIEAIFDRGAVATTAEMVGAASGVLDLTVAYAKQRVQFGEPIGRFQGVKHPLAEMYVDVESFKSLLYYAAWALDQKPEEAPLAASRAKAYASEAFARIGIESIGLHGGIGYTWEYDAQLYLKRAKASRPAFGDADHHYDRVAALGGL